ncbi:MAG TPA: NUDIX domain-containing protein [Pirellulaceae bacterium]|nr:NUDIX domain-containing protein [Pirellulaceae bacterium]HMO92294.1 NUDIX domain-containing protein [Pirellulaceae bacterium]HMP71011.1 NUDIX domain-containing protein [Pirellulaceae bacterium]
MSDSIRLNQFDGIVVPDNPVVHQKHEIANGIKSCGVIPFRQLNELSFLIMRHKDRWDFPKGHVDVGETELQCALRELDEETGIKPELIDIDPHFRFTMMYTVHLKRFNFEPRIKTLVMFLGFLNADVKIKPTEHSGFKWSNWSPPHRIQTQTIDPVLHAVETFWKNKPIIR